jgi:tetratricopeptide (TPR) repeat protein
MPKKKLTGDELLKQRREKLFVGRTEEREAFRRNFEAESPEYLAFAIHGQAGIGKSFLVDHYRTIVRQRGGLTALTNEAEATAVREQSIFRAMARLAEELADAGATLKEFGERYRKYRECMGQIEADGDAPPEAFKFLARTTARLALGAVETIPVGQAVSVVLEEAGVDKGVLVDQAGEWGAYLARKFRNKDEVALVKEPVETLTPLFVEEVNQLADDRPVLLCFDTWERTEGHLDEWVRDLRGKLSVGAWLVIAGRNLPGSEWEPFHPLMACFELKEFSEEETRGYLRQQGISEEARVADILSFSGGVPVLVSTLASAKGGSATEAADGLVDRYLKWVDDERQRETALTCAAARRLDRDVVAAVMGADDAATLFDWLTKMPFVQSRPGYWEYHPRVRKLMLNYVASRSTKEARATHEKLRAYYVGLLAEAGEGARYRDEQWRRYKLEALYHGLMQQSAKAERDGLETFLLTLRGYRALAGEVVRIWLQVAEEQVADAGVNRWAKLINEAWGAIESGSFKQSLPFCEEAGKREDLSDMARGEAYLLGGGAYLGMEDYAQSVSGFGKAIELDPQNAIAYLSRGLTYATLKEYEKAMADCNKAIELNPQFAAAYSNRGNIYYYGLEEYEKALADYNKAIELDPQYAAAYYRRGATYATLKEYEKAMADYNKAIELDPQDAVVYFNRGLAYAKLKEYEKAMAAYLEAECHLPSDAAELREQLCNAFVGLGENLRRLGKWEDSEAACLRAIELDPENAHGWNGLGLAYRRLKQWEEAEDAYRKSIGLDSKLAYPHNNLGCLYLQRERLEEAKEQFLECIRLLPNDALAAEVLSSVIACRQGEAQVARSHFDRALDIWETAWQSRLETPFDLLVCKALALLGVGRPQEAIVALRQALKQRPPDYTFDIPIYDLLLAAPQPLDGLGDMEALLREATGQ